MANLRRPAAALAAALLLIQPSKAAPPAADLTLDITGLRSGKGQVMLCLTRLRDQAFLNCDKDPARVVKVVPAARAAQIRLALQPGDYSLLLVHDENGNGRLDKIMVIPREGFAFSRNPVIRAGPPQYRDVHFALPGGPSRQSVKVRYLL